MTSAGEVAGRKYVYREKSGKYVALCHCFLWLPSEKKTKIPEKLVNPFFWSIKDYAMAVAQHNALDGRPA